MLTPQEVRAAEATLGQMLQTFRAAASLQEALGVVKQAVVEYASLGEEIKKAEGVLATLKVAVEKAQYDLADARTEKEKTDLAVAAIKAQLKGVGL